MCCLLTKSSLKKLQTDLFMFQSVVLIQVLGTNMSSDASAFLSQTAWSVYVCTWASLAGTVCFVG